jgi:hypothetical protein
MKDSPNHKIETNCHQLIMDLTYINNQYKSTLNNDKI